MRSQMAGGRTEFGGLCLGGGGHEGAREGDHVGERSGIPGTEISTRDVRGARTHFWSR